MKKTGAAALFGIFLLFGQLQAQSVDEVINKHVDAIGGAANWKKVNSVKSEATLSVQGMDIPLTMYQVHNKGMKQEFTVMNMSAFTIMRPDSGWNYMPFQGQTAPEPMTEEMIKMGKDQLDIQGEFLDYAAKGHKVELLGKEDVDGVEAFKVKRTTKLGNESVYFIDTKNYYVIRVNSKATVNGQQIESVTNFSNYQKLPEGIVMPFTMESSSIPAPITFKKIEVNPNIPDSVFKPTTN
jgi:outer membrane lipoprotein-sorting protein